MNLNNPRYMKEFTNIWHTPTPSFRRGMRLGSSAVSWRSSTTGPWRSSEAPVGARPCADRGPCEGLGSRVGLGPRLGSGPCVGSGQRVGSGPLVLCVSAVTSCALLGQARAQHGHMTESWLQHCLKMCQTRLGLLSIVWPWSLPRFRPMSSRVGSV